MTFPSLFSNSNYLHTPKTTATNPMLLMDTPQVWLWFKVQQEEEAADLKDSEFLFWENKKWQMMPVLQNGQVAPRVLE